MNNVPEIDRIIRSKRKSIALVVTADAKLVVRAPYRTSSGYIEDLVKKKVKWIIEKQQLALRKNDAHKDSRFENGEEFLFLGDKYRLEFQDCKTCVKMEPGRLILQEKEPDDAASDLRAWYRKQAKLVLNGRVEYYSKMTDIRYRSVKISGARKRWGSCGPGNTLNFTWRLVMAPLCVVDYVIVHEIAHVEFKNHSKQFWAKVESIMPDYGKHRTWLKDNQKLLELM